MKKLNYSIVIIVSSLILWGCGNDEEGVDSINTALFTEASDFVDPRDGHSYKCIKVGQQVWMAENLAYYMEGGSMSGCYTWDEEPYKAEDGDYSLDYEEWKEAIIEFADNTEPYSNGAMDYDYSTWPPQIVVQHMSDLISAYGSWVTTPDDMMQMLGYMSTWFTTYPDFTTEWELVQTAKEAEKAERKKNEDARLQSEETDRQNGNYSSKYGYLYTLDAARKAVPEGWRLPSDEDWKKLELALGMSASEVERNNAWRGINAGDYLKERGMSGFEAKLAGCNAYVPATNAQNYIHLNEGGYFWTNEEIRTETNGMVTMGESPDAGEATTGGSEVDDDVIREGMFRFVAIYSSQIWRGVTRLDNGYRETMYSVRCVKDAN